MLLKARPQRGDMMHNNPSNKAMIHISDDNSHTNPLIISAANIFKNQCSNLNIYTHNPNSMFNTIFHER